MENLEQQLIEAKARAFDLREQAERFMELYNAQRNEVFKIAQAIEIKKGEQQRNESG